MKRKIKEITLSIPLFRADISLFHSGTFDDFKNTVDERHGDAQKYSFGEKYDWEEGADTTDGYMFMIPAKHGVGEKFYVWIFEKSMYLLSHEILHLTGEILQHRGIKYTIETEEWFAYLHCYLMDEIFKLMKGKL